MDAQTSKKTSPLLILIIGVVIGLLIAGGFALVKSGFGRKNKNASPTTETRGIVLSISKPADGDVVTTSNLTIEGSSGKNALVAVTGGAAYTIVETSGGKFSIPTSLAEGENELNIYAFDPGSGESAQTTLDILYLKETLASGNVLIAASATSAAEKNKERIEKLREQISTKSSDLKAAVALSSSHILGVITSISETNLTIETNHGGLTTVFTDDLTKFLAIDDKGKSTIAFPDLKLGEAVAVVGLSRDNTVGLAKFVVKISKAATNRQTVAGKVASITDKTITIADLIRTDRTFTINAVSDTNIKIKGKETAILADIKVGDTLVACGTVDEKGVIAAKKLYVIPLVKTKVSTNSATPSSSQ